MKRLGYFEKLSLAARWLLPNDEAESMVEDYKDILYEVSGPEEALERFGKPWKPAMELADRRKVRRWYIVFVMMFFCAFVPFFTIFWQGAINNYEDFLKFAGDLLLCGVVYMFGLDVIFGGSNSRTVTCVSVALLTAAGIFFLFLHPAELIGKIFEPVERAVFYNQFHFFKPYQYIIFGSIISMVYFGFRKKKRKPLPKRMVISICAALFLIGCIYGFVMYCFHVDFGPMLHIFRVKLASEAATVLFFLGAVLGIVMARMDDPRWRSVYILCIMGIALCLTLHNVWWNMNPSLWVVEEHFNAGLSPTPEAVKDATLAFTWDLAFGIVFAAVGLL